MAGRKRKSMAPRFPCGKVIRNTVAPEPREIPPTPEVQTRRKAVFGREDADGELECVINILGRRLDEDQRMAARKARAVYNRFAAANRPPRTVSGQLRDFVQASVFEPMSADDQAEASADFDTMRRGVIREVRYQFRYSDSVRAGAASRQAWREVNAICHGEMPSNVYALKLGLEAVIEHFDLRADRARRSQQEALDRKAA